MDDKELRDAIWKRRSVRKYSDKHIEKDKIEIIERSISSLNKVSGLTVEFVEEYGSFKNMMTMMFRNVRSAIVVKGRADDPDLEEKCGYYGERIVLEATAMGLGTCWVAGFSKRNSSLNLKDGEAAVCVIPIGYGTEGFSESVDIPDAPHRRTKSVSEFLGGNTDAPDWVKAAMKAVQFAPTAMNSQMAKFHYKDGELSVDIPKGKLNMIDLGITKLHFELAAGGKFELGSPGAFKRY